jgi:hypothetical protein
MPWEDLEIISAAFAGSLIRQASGKIAKDGRWVEVSYSDLAIRTSSGLAWHGSLYR